MSVKIHASTLLPTLYGSFQFEVFTQEGTSKEHICLSCGNITKDDVPLVRMHSACMTGECFLSMKCECREQLHMTMQMMQEHGKGIIVYLDQEWRDIWLINKIKAYALQEQGMDTVEANHALDLPSDAREYSAAYEYLMRKHITKIRLVTNNPLKVSALEESGIQIIERVPLLADLHAINESYMKIKQQKMEHILPFDTSQPLSEEEDMSYMQMALEQAALCEDTLPNPKVGAILVRNREVVWVWHTQPYWWLHAEIVALQNASSSAKWATLYVTLEPCCHYGKTPPCTDALIEAWVSRVVFGCVDPYALVNGKWSKALQKAWVDVVWWVCEEQCKAINAEVFLAHSKKRPYVCIKFASSLDGKIATYTWESQFISSSHSREYTRSLRSKYQAIMVWKNTVLQDDPHLWSRTEWCANPLRIVLDSKLESTPSLQVYRDTHVLIATTFQADMEKIAAFEEKGIEILQYDAVRIPIRSLLDDLYQKWIVSVLVEWWWALVWSFVDASMIDEVYAVISPKIIGWADAATSIWGLWIAHLHDAFVLENVRTQSIGGDIHISWNIQH